jgi:predicted RNase H-like nuclease (RuvC/YqgF family)
MAKKKPFKQRIWTADEIRQLRAFAKQRLPAATIARRLKRSLDSTKKKASNLGVPLGAAARWSKDDLRRLRALAAKKQPVAKIAKTLQRTEAAVEKMASNVGVSLDMRA